MIKLIAFPFAYLFHTRIKGVIHKISWACIYFIPIGWLYLHYSQAPMMTAWAVMIVGFCLIDVVYSNGYIQNDVITTKNEINPTLRLSESMLLLMRERMGFIIGVRAVLCLVFALVLFGLDSAFALPFIALMLCLQVLYLIYNSQRNMLNLILIPFLSFLRFFALIVPFIWQDLGIMLALFALYPLPKLLEFSTQKRYKTSSFTGKFITNFDIFRIVYYLLLTALYSALWLWGGMDGVFVAVALYYLIFRLLCFVALQRASLASHIAHKRQENNPHKK